MVAGVRRVVVVVVGAMLGLALASGHAYPTRWIERWIDRNPDALWTLVDRQCVKDMREHGRPAPCEKVDLADGYVVLKDLFGHSQMLVLPTRRIAGIEAPALLEPGAPNYWQDAWDARKAVERRLGRPVPREAMGLAVNSAPGRTQNQLHIHVDCLRRGVIAALRMHGAQLGPQWSDFPVALARHRYRAMRLSGENLGRNDPFKLLADANPQARADMGRQTLVVAGLRSPTGAPGFVVLSRQADLRIGDLGHGEELLDHACKALAAPDSNSSPAARTASAPTR